MPYKFEDKKTERLGCIIIQVRTREARCLTKDEADHLKWVNTIPKSPAGFFNYQTHKYAWRRAIVASANDMKDKPADARLFGKEPNDFFERD